MKLISHTKIITMPLIILLSTCIHLSSYGCKSRILGDCSTATDHMNCISLHEQDGSYYYRCKWDKNTCTKGKECGPVTSRRYIQIFL